MAHTIDARLMRLLESALSKAGESKVADALSGLATDDTCKAEIGAYDSGMNLAQNSPELEDSLTAAQAAKELGLSGTLIARYCQNGRISATATTTGWRIPRSAIAEFQSQPRVRTGRPRKNPAVA